jgi:hypothetical protein
VSRCPTPMQTLPELLVPYGVPAHGPMVRAANALRGTRYNCPGCAALLVLRDGPSKEIRKHFAHPSRGACSQESIEHKTAKRLILELLQENSRGTGGAIEVHGECPCGGGAVRTIVPGSFTHAHAERSVGEYRPDVVGYGVEGPRLAIEILHTHAMPQRKAESLKCRWVELRAAEIIECHDSWRPVRAHLRALTCRSCAELRAECTELGLPEGTYTTDKRNVDTVPYVVARSECWKCHAHIPVFWWRGVPFSQVPPPEPAPRSILWRASRRFNGMYYANTCLKCRAVQGDNFLFLFDGSPFRGMPLNNSNIPLSPVPHLEGNGRVTVRKATPALVRGFAERVGNLIMGGAQEIRGTKRRR